MQLNDIQEISEIKSVKNSKCFFIHQYNPWRTNDKTDPHWTSDTKNLMGKHELGAIIYTNVSIPISPANLAVMEAISVAFSYIC